TPIPAVRSSPWTSRWTSGPSRWSGREPTAPVPAVPSLPRHQPPGQRADTGVRSGVHRGGAVRTGGAGLRPVVAVRADRRPDRPGGVRRGRHRLVAATVTASPGTAPRPPPVPLSPPDTPTPYTSRRRRTMAGKELVRSTDDRVIAGVCAGVAAYLNVDANIVRIATVVLSFITGIPIIA